MKKPIALTALLLSSAVLLTGCTADKSPGVDEKTSKSDTVTLTQSVSVDKDKLAVTFDPSFKLDGWSKMDIPAEEAAQYEESAPFRSSLTVLKEDASPDMDKEGDLCYITAEVAAGDTMPGLEGAGDKVLTERHIQNRGGEEVGVVAVKGEAHDVELLKYKFQEEATTVKPDNVEQEVDVPAADRVYFIRALDIKPEKDKTISTIPLLQVTYSCAGEAKVDQKIVDKLEKAIIVSGVTTTNKEG